MNRCDHPDQDRRADHRRDPQRPGSPFRRAERGAEV
nr:MAG TPA: hypothetical protein [Caudoviricetes sp.]DAU42672.1 MAG TPA: hypothetical protein [Caudoviricetes sp.]